MDWGLGKRDFLTLLFDDQAGFHKGLNFVFAPPGFGFFEFAAVNGGDHIDPAGQHGVAFICFARPGRVIGMAVKETDDVKTRRFRRHLLPDKFFGRESEVKTAAAFPE